MSIRDYAPVYFEALQRYSKKGNGELSPVYRGNCASVELEQELTVYLYYESDGRTDTMSVQLFQDGEKQFQVALPLRLGDRAQIQGIVSGHLKALPKKRRRAGRT